MDPHVVVFCASAMGCCFVGFSSQGAGLDFYSCASGVQPLVLDTPGDRDHRMGWIRSFSQQQENAEKAQLAFAGSGIFVGGNGDDTPGGHRLFQIHSGITFQSIALDAERASVPSLGDGAD